MKLTLIINRIITIIINISLILWSHYEKLKIKCSYFNYIDLNFNNFFFQFADRLVFEGILRHVVITNIAIYNNLFKAIVVSV